jgi:hypothetical protein
MNNRKLSIPKTLEVFQYYLNQQDLNVLRAQFEKNLFEKQSSELFLNDTSPLLKTEIAAQWNSERPLKTVQNQVISLLPGEAWKGEPAELIKAT